MTQTDAAAWPKGIGAITLFVEDLDASKRFYEMAFGLPAVFEDKNSVVFKMGGTLINLLKIESADELVAPAQVARRDAGSRHVFWIEVDDVDAMCTELAARGVSGSTPCGSRVGFVEQSDAPSLIPRATSGKSESNQVPSFHRRWRLTRRSTRTSRTRGLRPRAGRRLACFV